MTEILYRDEWILIANKPSGIPVHETKDPKRENFTIILQKELGLEYIRTVNRLDLETSGLVVFGLDETKNIEIDNLLKNSEKYYLAIVYGKTDPSFRIESFLKDGNKKVRTVRSGGKKAITEFKNLYYNEKENYSIMQAKLITGRRHQIRIHLYENGNSILGEKIYTENPNSKLRCMLQAYRIDFTNLKEEKISIKTKIPEDFKKYLADELQNF
jgi:23S rRNA pseudouridine1911/1915/1917 synthase